MTWIRIRLGYLQLIETFTKLSCLNVKLLFSMSLQARLWVAGEYTG